MEKIDEMIKNKREIANMAVYEGEKIITELSDEEIKALEEFYEPHFLSGVMAQNTPAARTTEQVWIKNGKYAK